MGAVYILPVATRWLKPRSGENGSHRCFHSLPCMTPRPSHMTHPCTHNTPHYATQPPHNHTRPQRSACVRSDRLCRASKTWHAKSGLLEVTASWKRLASFFWKRRILGPRAQPSHWHHTQPTSGRTCCCSADVYYQNKNSSRASIRSPPSL